MNSTRNLVALAVTAALTTPMSALATNGMNLEGYGPISTGMGGASMAIENGTAAMANNPATLDMLQGENQVDAALGVLAPDVSVSNAQGSADSASNSFTMPAAGWARKHNKDLTYGVGVFSQGGMGAEYGKSSFMAAGTGQEARSEIGVGRVIFPASFKVNDKLSVGGSFDYVWGGLDMKMPMALDGLGPAQDLGIGDTPAPGTFGDFMTEFGGDQILGEANITGTFDAANPNNSTGFIGALHQGYSNGIDAVAVNFSDSSSFTQKASGTGYGAKLGMTFQHSEDLVFGAAYHMKTAMGDWEGDAEMAMYNTDGDGAAEDAAYDGTITIDNFQWPTTIALGGAFTPNDKLLLAADLKMLQWAEVMKDFSMTFEPDDMPGQKADFTIYQDWDDQIVISLGGAYKLNPKLTVRGGANLSSNPVPDKYVHPLFPATIENHYTAGVGYDVTSEGSVNFSLTHAPKVSVTNSNTDTDVDHAQTNWQLMYSQRF